MPDDGKSAIRNTLVTGMFAVLGVALGGVLKGCADVQLARQKLDADLVLRAVSADSPRVRESSLRFLLSTQLIQDSRIRDGLHAYFDTIKGHPEAIPQIGGSGQLSTPVVSNARVFLLAGTAAKRDQFRGMTNEFARAGFGVLGDSVLEDETRPLEPEVRYYNAADSAQAAVLAAFLAARLHDPTIRATLCDKDHKDIAGGYIELWAGGSAASQSGRTCPPPPRPR